MVVAGGGMGFNVCSGPWDEESNSDVMASFTNSYSIPEGEVKPAARLKRNVFGIH